MSGIIDWFARNSVAANLLMVFIIVSGAFSAFSVKQEVFPEFSLDMVTIEVPYLGAAPEEVEEAVNVRLEEAIQGIDGIKQITSTASEGSGSVMIELDLGADARKVVDDVKSNVDAISTFPDETEQPIIREIRSRRGVIDIAVSGMADEVTLKRLAERVRDDLAALPEITQVEMANARPYEISIEVSEASLRRHGLTFQAVAEAVRRSSLDLPGGSVRTDGGEILLRTIGQAYRGNEFEDLVVWTRPDGSRLHLRDVATVIDGFAETDQMARFDIEPTMLVSVFRTGDQSALDIADAVHAYVAEGNTRNGGIHLTAPVGRIAVCLGPECTTRGTTPRCVHGFPTMPRVGTTWTGCAGLRVSDARPVTVRRAGSWAAESAVVRTAVGGYPAQPAPSSRTLARRSPCGSPPPGH